MAGNIVKWWKHKIFGGYKQFSVLQECTTDSEELMYHQVRAASSCSAPPDLLLVSDRENNVPLLKSAVNVIATTPAATSTTATTTSSKQHHSSGGGGEQQQHHREFTTKIQKTPPLLVDLSSETPASKPNISENNDGDERTEHRMHLEEFTCDVSVESGKSSQPLQFSFTFYDLDGHHGKITKDDIVGIVYTIYESIGKSVVVPHHGSKTINVRLTVSPEGKSKSSKLKKMQEAPVIHHHHHGGHPRRQHRYRPRKLIKTDDEEDDTSSEKDNIPNHKKLTHHHHHHKLNNKQHSTSNSTSVPIPNVTSNQFAPINKTEDQTILPTTPQLNNCKFRIRDDIYNKNEQPLKIKETAAAAGDDGCKECTAAVSSTQHQQAQQQFLKQAATRAKLLRKSRKHKEQIYESRQRSLSMSACNERCWKKRMDEKPSKVCSANNTPLHHDLIKQPPVQSQQQHQSQNTQDCVDGGSNRAVDGGSTIASAKCWNNALKRNDLIDIIRESMEKNRLCFQSNGKPQSNMSPIRHRQRSKTVSKITTDFEKCSPVHYNQLYSQTVPEPHVSSSGGIHVPIYHQHQFTTINPAHLTGLQQKLVASEKCGYDSFLHATICGGGHHSPNNNNNNNNNINNNNNNSQHHHHHPETSASQNQHNYLQPTKLHAINNNKAVRHQTGYYSQQNSPPFHGYHRLASSTTTAAESTKLNTSVLRSMHPEVNAEDKLNRTIHQVEKWLTERDESVLKANDLKLLKSNAGDDNKCKKDVKNYDNLLYAKLNEKLVMPRNGGSSSSPVKSSLNNNKENIRRMKNFHEKLLQQQRRNCLDKNAMIGGGSSKIDNLIPVKVDDPLECENLIQSTTDDESVSPTPSNMSAAARATAEENNSKKSCSSSTVHRYVHEHIHHHYHHFENKQN